MRKVFASLALLLALCAPAHAAIAILAGGGTGNAIGSGSVTSASATFAITTTADAPPGTLLVVGGEIRANPGTMNSCTDNAATPNTYSALPPSAPPSQPLANARIFYTIVGTDLPNGGTITCTFNTAASDLKALIAVAFTGAAASPADGTGTITSATGVTNSLSNGPTPTLACPGSGNCEVVVAVSGFSSVPSAITETGSFTSLGAAINVGDMHMAYLIVSANTAIIYNPTVTMVSGNTAGVMAGFVQATGGATPICTLSTLGVGSC